MRFNVGHDRHAGGARDRPGAGAEVNNPPKPRTRSVLDCSVRLTGDLWSEGDVQLDGHLCGNISCGQLIVGKDAAVTGVIIAQEAVIRGKITGIIRATRVLLQETARVESEIIYRTLAVDEGATFEGIARPRPNPLAEDFTVPAMPEARGRTGEPEAAAANGAGAERSMAGQAGALEPADTRRQLEGPSAARG